LNRPAAAGIKADYADKNKSKHKSILTSVIQDAKDKSKDNSLAIMEIMAIITDM